MKKFKVGQDPKAKAGQKKMAFDHIPISALLNLSEGMADGAVKYGKHNWVEEDTELDNLVYINAVIRHCMLYLAGEDLARDSGVSHLTHAMSGIAVLLDADLMGNTVDTRTTLSKEALDKIAKRICGKEYAELPLLED